LIKSDREDEKVCAKSLINPILFRRHLKHLALTHFMEIRCSRPHTNIAGAKTIGLPRCAAPNLHHKEKHSTASSSSPLFIFLAETRLQHIGACKRNQATNPCHQGSVYNPACASNGRTYASAQHVRCLKAANPALEVLHDGACTVQEVEKIVGLDDVCRMAMHRYEWNPICGADNVTYTNAYTFLCAAKKTPEDKSKTYFFLNHNPKQG